MIEEKGGRVRGLLVLLIYLCHITDDLPDFSKLTELSRDEWDKLVDQFINIPAKWTQSCS